MIGELTPELNELIGYLEARSSLKGTIEPVGEIEGDVGVAILKVPVEKDYSKLQNKPTVNNVELSGNKTSRDLNVVGTEDEMTVQLINDAWNAIFG